MIKVYFANTALLENAEQFEKWLCQMHPARKEKIEKCRQVQDKVRSLLAGVLLRYALEQEGLTYENLEFGIAEHGKPVLKSAPDIHFSISHAGNYALCCISDQIVGADIEVMEKRIFEKEEQLCKVAQKVLSETENKLFFNSNFEKKKQLFLKFWTRKESYSKTVGKGLGMDFSKIDTECCEGTFWSEWLETDCFVSVYTQKESCVGITMQQLMSLDF